MEEAIELALKHHRERHDELKQDVENLEKSFAAYREINRLEHERTRRWDKYKTAGFIMVGLWLSTMPQYLPFLQILLSP